MARSSSGHGATQDSINTLVHRITSTTEDKLSSKSSDAFQKQIKALVEANHLLDASSTVSQLARFCDVLIAIAIQSDDDLSILAKCPSDGPQTDSHDGTIDTDRQRNTADVMEARIRDGLGQSSKVEHPFSVHALLSLACHAYTASIEELTVDKNASDDKLARSELTDLSIGILAVVRHLLNSSERNAAAIHMTGALSLVLPALTNEPSNKMWIEQLTPLAHGLLSLGLTSLEDARQILFVSSYSESARSLLLDSLRSSRAPASFIFDLSLQGFASLEFPELKQAFPPSDAARGYSLMFWLKVDQFDDRCHTTLFGAFDSSQTCFLLVYLERRHRYLVLQTSVSSKEPSVRFKDVHFEQGVYYHVVLVHQKSRRDGTGKALLFVDGVPREHVRCALPRSPPTVPATRDTYAQARSLTPVQAFLGTPQALSPSPSPVTLTSRWSLASAYLINDVIPDELVYVYHKLGPSYRGNFQDSLGSFQTYDASALVNMHNEKLHSGNEDQSNISKAVKSQTASLLSESSILVNVSPAFTVDHREGSRPDEHASSARLSPALARRVLAAGPVVLNAAAPTSSRSISSKSAYASILGGTTIDRPLTMQDCVWKLLGCLPVGLSMVATSSSPEMLILGVSIFFETSKDNWRNSEAMERGGGYSILSWLLQLKFELPSSTSTNEMHDVKRLINTTDGERDEFLTSLLKLIIKSTTLKYEQPSEAIITNPLAYRMVLIDNDLWQAAGRQSQCRFFDQISIFLRDSRYKSFNAKRLTRMRIFKRLFEVLKASQMSQAVLDSALKAFRILLDQSATADTLRSTALYITYALHVDGHPRIKSMVSFKDGENMDVAASNHERGSAVLKMLSEFLCRADERDSIRRFARSVTTQWLLHLIDSTDERVVIYALRILSYTLVVAGDSYRIKFESKKGFVILADLLRRWYYSEEIWLLMFVLLFGLDLTRTKLKRLSDIGRWLDTARNDADLVVKCPRTWDVMTSMLEAGLSRQTASLLEPSKGEELGASSAATSAEHVQDTIWRQSHEETYLTVLSLLTALFDHLVIFREFLASNEALRSVLNILYAAIAAVPEENGQDQTHVTSKVQSSPKVPDASPSPHVPSLLMTAQHRRISEYVVLQAVNGDAIAEARFLRPLATTTYFTDHTISGSRCFVEMVKLLASLSIEQIEYNKDFNGFGLFLKAPDASSARRSWLNSLIMHRILEDLEHHLSIDTHLLQSTKSLTNIVRFMHQSYDAAITGWYQDQSCTLIRVMAMFIRRLGQRDVRNLKSVRLCMPSVAQAQHTLLMMTLLQLALLSERRSEGSGRGPYSRDRRSRALPSAKVLCGTLCSTSTFVLTTSDSESISESSLRSEPRFVPAFCILLITCLYDAEDEVKPDLLQIFRHLAAPNQDEVRSCLTATSDSGKRAVADMLLNKVLKGEDQDALEYLSDHRQDIDALLSDVPRAALESIIHESNSQTRPNVKSRLARRQDRLDAAHLVDLERQHALTEYAAGSRAWNENITSAESFKAIRCRQDRQENAAHMLMQFIALQDGFNDLISSNGNKPQQKWSLDESEGRDRMRLRLAPTTDAAHLNYKPKRNARSNTMPTGRQENVQALRERAATAAQPTTQATTVRSPPPVITSDLPRITPMVAPGSPLPPHDEEYELVHGQERDDGTEDKNRKVMRSLQQGEQVIDVYNTSRVRGLEACEGLLIVGAKAMYIVDDLFQRADGEVVSTTDAPEDERDPYVQMISGRTISRGGPHQNKRTSSSTRHWRWQEVISISKRNFLLRPVAIEVFFGDGRSYLLTACSEQQRNRLYRQLMARATRLQPSNVNKTSDDWRPELLVNVKETSATVTGRFANVLSFGPTFAHTAKWVKGELSNFQYLMLVNTLAGRTFNDLTQYPIFPWVLADYTSEELDLDNPRSFRDLSKPMGCQNPEREAAFKDRYRTFAEMSDDRTTAFHYGTHYSTAMIVTSYLIRLQPYVDSYLLLQGGSFDHADRLFYSIEKAWASASQTNMTDVRELIPEFFYLPEMLTNVNKYDFGEREANGESISDVQLPPWAKGDPKLFVAKHREALESPYVSQHLHEWIDLIFGAKQRGEAAVEATNVFHHLSYQGSINLDTISDPVERLATIGIIHNFGQTPRQVFARPHEQRDVYEPKTKRLHRGLPELNRHPSLVFEYHSRVCEIEHYDGQRVICAGPGRSYMHPHYGIVLDWGHVNSSIKFWKADTKKTRPLAIYEQLHQEGITAAVFSDRTLVTSSLDCTVALWNVTPNLDADMVDLQPETFLFGHRSPVTVLAVSSVHSLILSAETTGMVILWDLNTHDTIRRIELARTITAARINDSNGHLLFASADSVILCTINGEVIVNQRVCTATDDSVFCCAFYVSSGNDWIDTELIFTGHRRGVANVWRLAVDKEGHWYLKHLRQLAHVDRSPSEHRASVGPITAIKPTDALIYTGDEAGRVFEWKYAR